MTEDFYTYDETEDREISETAQPQEDETQDSHFGVARIKVIGVGGAGGNAVNRLIESGLKAAEYYVINTDNQVLARSLAQNRIQIGVKLTKGLGAGADPSVGKLSAEENKDRIQQILKGTDLLFITAGGTITSVRTQQGLKPVLTSDELLAHLPELKELCCPETLALCSIDSTDLGQEHWLMMARAIQENYALYDGFIICHGTDTLAYSAAALSYLIQNADKPIILTGAQQPISNEITDAKKNLRDSVVCAIDPGSRGVMVVFGGHVIAGTRAKKNKTISYDAFASVNFPELALVQGDRLVRYIPSPWPTGPVEFSRTLDSRVFLLKLTPGMSPALIPEIFRLYDCVIVESFGVGGIPQQLMDAFAAGLGDYETTHKVLIMTTQVTYEGSDVGVYEVGKRVRNRFRFLEAHDMTIEAVVTKSMWLLAQNCESFDQLQQRFYRQVNFDTFYH